MAKTIVHLSGSLLDRSAVREQARALDLKYQQLQTASKNYFDIVNDRNSILAIDLTYIGAEALEQLAKNKDLINRSITYCSHVERDLITKAEQLGFKSLPRSKFFSELHEIIAAI